MRKLRIFQHRWEIRGLRFRQPKELMLPELFDHFTAEQGLGSYIGREGNGRFIDSKQLLDQRIDRSGGERDPHRSVN